MITLTAKSTTKQHTVVSIRLIVTCRTYPETFTRDNVGEPFVSLYVVTVILPVLPRLAWQTEIKSEASELATDVELFQHRLKTYLFSDPSVVSTFVHVARY